MFNRWSLFSLIVLFALCLCASVVIVLGCATHRQVGYWRDSHTLFSRAVAVTQDNYKMHNQLGYLASQEGRHEEAVREFQEALRIAPNYELAAGNLLFELQRQKQ